MLTQLTVVLGFGSDLLCGTERVWGRRWRAIALYEVSNVSKKTTSPILQSNHHHVWAGVWRHCDGSADSAKLLEVFVAL